MLHQLPNPQDERNDQSYFGLTSLWRVLLRVRLGSRATHTGGSRWDHTWMSNCCKDRDAL